MRSQCPNCKGFQLKLSNILQGEAKSMIYCTSCFWSEEEDREIDKELFRLAIDLDSAFQMYVACSKGEVPGSITFSDIEACIKDLYRHIIFKEIT